MKRPTDEQIDAASEWLRLNEGELGEAEACRAVADWIDHQANEAELRKAARDGRTAPAGNGGEKCTSLVT